MKSRNNNQINKKFLTQEQLAAITILENEIKHLKEQNNSLIISYITMIANMLFLEEAICDRIVETAPLLQNFLEAYFFKKSKYNFSPATIKNIKNDSMSIIISVYTLLAFIVIIENMVTKSISQLLAKPDLEKTYSIKTEFLAPHEANERIKELNQKYLSLKKTKTWQQSGVFATLLLYRYYAGAISGPSLPLFYLNLLFLMISSLKHNIFTSFNFNSIDQLCSTFNNCLHEITKNYESEPLSFHKGKTLEQTYFIFKSKAHEKDENNKKIFISDKTICQIVRGILLKSGIHILSYGRTRILIGGDNFLDLESAKKISINLETAINKHVAVKALKKQVNAISDSIKEKYWLTFLRDLQGFVMYHFLLPIPTKYSSLITFDKIKAIFDSCHIAIESNHLIIEGNSSGDNQLLEDFIMKIEKFENEIHQSYSLEESFQEDKSLSTPLTLTQSILALPKERLSRPVKFSLVNEIKTEDNTKDNKNKSQHHDLIKWKSGTYDPNSNKNNIVPIRSTHCSNNRKFLLFGLKPEHFPDDQYFLKHQKVTEHPVWACKHGQGIKGCHETVKHADTKEAVNADAKSKPGGRGGIAASRMFFTSEKSLTQNGANTLYVGVSFDPNPHKD